MLPSIISSFSRSTRAQLHAGSARRFASSGALGLCLLIGGCAHLQAAASEQDKAHTTQQNVIFILTDDQRYDQLGFMNPEIQTPNIDKLASEGVHFKNAFVTTSLCSPSRASILTGQYMHNHGVVDNNSSAKASSRFFPEYLQQAGYQTAFVGKWHMGGTGGNSHYTDDPQPGFDYWLSFPGQGNYFPVKDATGKTNSFNINGKRVEQKAYITDELTDYSLNWLNEQQKASGANKKPFFLYLSHKAVHADFAPAPRHENIYANVDIALPDSMANTPENYVGKPMWVKNQRNSWHGVDFPYHSTLNVAEYKRQYYRAIAAVDDSIGRIMQYLEDNQLKHNTSVFLMGDNGFLFGEHGLIDKRNAYEESIRVPLLLWSPSMVKPSQSIEKTALGIDIAPTILDIAGAKSPSQFEGDSLLPLINSRFESISGKRAAQWRDSFLYEYYWEFNYPHTPTTFALRTDKYKLIQYHGVWDTEELYDIQNDPKEMNNLIEEPALLRTKVEMREKLFELLADNDGNHTVPYTEKYNSGAVLRNKVGAKAAEFPNKWLRGENAADRTQYFTPDRQLLERNEQEAKGQAKDQAKSSTN
ncbi:sulfatase [Glaciecola siphonariae]|uniref:Sulfatase n=1 Tax=Glaciecola siphonariae TaxID=521012 RepID=A0ABV9LWY0_9ALTE